MSNPEANAMLASELKVFASTLGFHLSGICPAVDATGFSQLVQWLDRGYAGEMAYLHKRLDAYQHPRGVLESVQSLLVLGFPYRTSPPHSPSLGSGRVARYAWGVADYHDLIHDRLQQLIRFLQSRVPDVQARGVVDSAPLLEREFAQLAGLGWRGKNTLLLNKSEGSYFFLAALLTDLPLPLDDPVETNHCGTCRACLDACPTQAFPEPYVLDATRCVSYLTIELRKAIPFELRSGLGDWVFGCDVCQDVCPWNRRERTLGVEELWPDPTKDPLPLYELFDLDDETFRQRFRKTPFWRSKRRGLLRNAAIVLGNQQDGRACVPLAKGLSDNEPLVRGASGWALGQIGTFQARALLQRRLPWETDVEVRQEIQSALNHIELTASGPSAP